MSSGASSYFKELKDAINEIQTDIKSGVFVTKVSEIMMPEIKEDLDKIIKNHIMIFYDQYPPIYYRRKRGLLDSYKITYDQSVLTMDFDSDFIPNHYNNVSTGYIFDTVFMEGYHGGAKNGPNHPSPKVPYWRTPSPFSQAAKSGIPAYSLWGRPAIQTESPNKLVDKGIKEYSDSEDLSIIVSTAVYKIFSTYKIYTM